MTKYYEVELRHTYYTHEFVIVGMPDDYEYRLSNDQQLWRKAREASDPHGWEELPFWDGEQAEVVNAITYSDEQNEDREGYLLSQREKEQEEMKDNVYPT
tara:strand:+ start:4560 stop:4859 length:300 start_codon:yes stop_codon:yes gene_type:complete